MSESLPNLFTFDCPCCEQTLFCRPSMEVDAVREPVVRDLLLRGRLNTFHCEGCGHRGDTPIPAFYRDERLGLNATVVYVPPHLNRGGQGPQGEALRRFLGVARELVFTMADMARLVRLWEKMATKKSTPSVVPQYRKAKMNLLRRIGERFEPGRLYAPEDVCAEIAQAMRKENQAFRNDPSYSADHLRLGLVELGLLAREPDGSRYWALR
jgi:hypothetical protein